MKVLNSYLQLQVYFENRSPGIFKLGWLKIREIHTRKIIKSVADLANYLEKKLQYLPQLIKQHSWKAKRL